MPHYSVVDIETTGGQNSENKITEIAIINFDGKNIIEEFSTLINPERSIPYSITQLTGISNEMVKDAPKFYEVAKKIVEMTEGKIFVAHNVFFDFNFIKHEFSDLGFSFLREKICTVRLGRKILPGHKSYSLGKICADLDIPISQRHRALGDARATVELFKKILQVSGSNINEYLIKESKKISLPPLLSRETYENLPSIPGVYYFYNKEGDIIYIGKAKDIKKRASSHFRVDIKRKKDIELKNSIAHIEVKSTGNELCALLIECHEIKKYRPRFNIGLNRVRFPYSLILKKDKNGQYYLHPTKSQLEKSYLKFNNLKAAKKTKNRIYKALLGVEEDSIHFMGLKNNLINTIGLPKFNHMLLKLFTKETPHLKDDRIKLKGRDKDEECMLYIKDHSPEKIIYIKNNDKELFELQSDPDMIQILKRYLKA